MKSLFKINLAILALNFLLYCMPAIGMFFQVLTGMVQLVSAGMLTSICIKRLKGRGAALLWCYWMAVALNIALMAYICSAGKSLNTILFPVPLIIACYFVYVTHQFKDIQP